MNALIFAGGVAVGVLAMLYHTWSVRRAVEKERQRVDRLHEENRRLQVEMRDLISARDCADAFRRGKERGRNDPTTEAERFARNFEGRRASFRGERSTAA